MKTELKPVYDYHKSFYGKAYTETFGGWSQKTRLYSYGTVVAEIGYLAQYDDRPVAILFDKWNYSNTTLRHTKEFLAQNGFGYMTKAVIRKVAIDKGDYLIIVK